MDLEEENESFDRSSDGNDSHSEFDDGISKYTANTRRTHQRDKSKYRNKSPQNLNTPFGPALMSPNPLTMNPLGLSPVFIPPVALP